MNELERLKSEIGIVIYTFSDGSKQFICTTLDGDKLPPGVFAEKGYLYDLMKCKYVPFRKDAVEVEVVFDLDQANLTEVDKFVNRFI